MSPQRPHAGRTVAGALVLLLFGPTSARAQQSVADVLSFLLINRSIPTADFTRDDEAARATSDSIAALLLLELATLPISASGSGFTYRLDPQLGIDVRSSDSFGPFFTERSLTAGRRQVSFDLSYRSADFHSIDGRSLRDGTLVGTASRLRGTSQPFDVETLTLRLRADTAVFALNYGVTDRLDVSAALPVVRVELRGERLDTYRGQQLLQASGTAEASGLGDLVVRTKYNVWRRGASGLSFGAEARLPTGDEANLLGSGKAALKPRVVASVERERLGVHGDVGYQFGGLSRELNFSAAVTAAALPTITLVGELNGRQVETLGRLSDVTQAHPLLAGVETIRLTGAARTTTRLAAVAGVKLNVARTFLISANVLRTLTKGGLTARWIPSVTVDYAFGR